MNFEDELTNQRITMYFEHLTPSSVAPSTTKYIRKSCQLYLSSTVTREEKVCLKNEQEEVYEKLGTQRPTGKEASFNSELPPGLADDILSLHEDYLKKDSEDEVVGNRSGLTERQKNPGSKTSLNTWEKLEGIITLRTNEDIDSKLLLCNNNSYEDPTLLENKQLPHAVGKKGLENPETSDLLLKKYFALKGKTLKSLNDKDTHKADTVSASELQLAVKEQRILHKVLFIKPESLGSKLSKPINTETNADETLNNCTVRPLLQDKVNLSGNSNCSFVPSLLLSRKQLTVPVPPNPCLAVSRPATAQEIVGTNREIPGEFIEPEPPDLTRYTCSEELKQAVKTILSEKRSGQPVRKNLSQVRYHPYQRTETNYQKTLPKLPEFQ